MSLFKQILADTTMLKQTITKATTTMIDLVEHDLNDNHFQAGTIHLNDERIFLPNVDKNINALLQL